MKTLFEKSGAGKHASSLPLLDVPEVNIPRELMRQSSFVLPELTEPELVQHYIELSRRTFGIDNGFYPLGSCTMKYNPKINEECAALSGFTSLHPLSPPHLSQGSMRLLYDLEKLLEKLTGFARFSLQPVAGAQAEFTALLMAKAWFHSQGEVKRTKVLIPDVAHGTNPASVKLVGWQVHEIKTSGGIIDIESVRDALDDTVACIMVTNPNTLGIFERDIVELNEMIHKAGGLSYLDGANFNALLGRYLPAEQGFDCAHFNLHKTFATPHGGGGPGVGALGVADFLIPFLPVPVIKKKSGQYVMDFDRPESIGKLVGFWGNFLILLRAYAYILTIGKQAHEISEMAVSNAYYLAEKLCPPYELAYKAHFLHEFVISCEKIHRETGIRAFDIAKRLMDFGFHPPTMYFPLTVKEALMIEPTETVSQETLDMFGDAMLTIYQECYKNPDIIKSAPHHTYVRRVNEVKAVRDMKLRANIL